MSQNSEIKHNSKQECRVATAIYGSYDCIEVLILRRYRNIRLQQGFFAKFI